MSTLTAADVKGLQPGAAELAALILNKFPQLAITSAYRPGDANLHGKGEAIDLAGPPDVMEKAAAWINEHFGDQLLEGIHNPGLSIDTGKDVPPSFWGNDPREGWQAHANHIHVAIDKLPDIQSVISTDPGLSLKNVLDDAKSLPEKVADAVLDSVFAPLARKGARILLYVVLVLGGMALAVTGFARLSGVHETAQERS